mmetsp:Transcript_42038/g.91196  ORF Transcript_42038/g.91196 Transcript_42038/m.91196 type:complete len:119 (-) Transcript_42038:146-502(-)
MTRENLEGKVPSSRTAVQLVFIMKQRTADCITSRQVNRIASTPEDVDGLFQTADCDRTDWENCQGLGGHSSPAASEDRPPLAPLHASSLFHLPVEIDGKAFDDVKASATEVKVRHQLL